MRPWSRRSPTSRSRRSREPLSRRQTGPAGFVNVRMVRLARSRERVVGNDSGGSKMRLLPARTVSRRVASLVLVAVVAAGFAAGVVFVPAAGADPGPIAQRSASGVTADVLPTVQIDGVVWSQAVVGNTVYAGGSFATARPAGSAPGVNTTVRGNLLAYDLTTGALIDSFAPVLNRQVRVVTASPDGSQIYVGGDFTTADGVDRYRIAAYSTSTGQLISSFAPVLDYVVKSIVATATTVYVGGSFST